MTKVIELPIDTITEAMCCYAGCTQKHKIDEGRPAGWTSLVITGDRRNHTNLLHVRSWVRDAALCPTHTALIDALLKPLSSGLTERLKPKQNIAEALGIKE